MRVIDNLRVSALHFFQNLLRSFCPGARNQNVKTELQTTKEKKCYFLKEMEMHRIKLVVGNLHMVS